MKCAGIFAIVLAFSLVLFSGCVQIIINAPAIPGAAPAATPIPGTIVADDFPGPVATTAAVVSSPPAPVTGPRFIVPVGDAARVGHRSFTFHYAPSTGQHEYTFQVPVNMSVYYGARQMKIDLPVTSQDKELVQEYIDSFENDPAMEELYASVISQLRNARYQNGRYLSDDEYFELIVAFVQQIPFVENPSPKRKYPIEVIYDKAGDSDEKSLLLVNLLAREDYDVAMIVFEERGYETTGIRVTKEVPDASLKVFTTGKKDYVYIDASTPRFIGSVPEDFQNYDDPAVFPVGNGTKRYGQINYVWMIITDLNHMKQLGRIPAKMVFSPWDRTGTCMWIKNSKLLFDTTCYCCDT